MVTSRGPRSSSLSKAPTTSNRIPLILTHLMRMDRPDTISITQLTPPRRVTVNVV